MKNEIKKNVLTRNQTTGGRTGPSQPPKNSTVMSAEINVTPRYSPTKNMPNFIPEYSEWYPATSSLSASGMSNGVRRVSARPAMTNKTKPRNWGMTNQILCCASTIDARLNDPASTTTPINA